MKIVVVIPAYNEATAIGDVISGVPSSIDGMKVTTLVVDDGSTDDTAKVVAAVDDRRIRLVRQDNKGVSAARNRGMAYYGRGLGHAQKREYDTAIANFDAAIRLAPSYTPAFLNRGTSYINKGEYDRAIADFDQALKIDPDNALGYYFRGWAYSSKGNLDRAIEEYSEAIRLEPGAYLYSWRGDAYRNKGDHERALADYEEAIRINPSHAAAYFGRGSLHLDRRDAEEQRAGEAAGRADAGLHHRLVDGEHELGVVEGLEQIAKLLYPERFR